MSEVRLVVRDATRSIYADRHGCVTERVIAALSDEPETIEELGTAIRRFSGPDDTEDFHGFTPGMDDTPYDAGLVVVDLAARLVVCDSTYSSASHKGHIRRYGRGSAETIDLPYHLSDDWRIIHDACDWTALANQRRQARRDDPPLDARAVLYGDALTEFIAAGCFEAFRDRPVPAKRDYQDPEYQQEYERIRQVHVRWMMTARDDLRGQTPRQVMMARHGYIGWNMQDREEQWSMTGKCPRGLDPESSAYRFAGFGTHEMVMYYDLVRELLWACRYDLANRINAEDGSAWTVEAYVAEASPCMAEHREWWLDEPDPEFGGRTPRSIIHNERARIPEGMSGHEAMVDCDCPLCQMMAESSGPVFWNMDGCNMDEDFAFSMWHETLEEWEEEQRREEAYEREWQAKRKNAGSTEQEDTGIWRTSFSAPITTGQSPAIRLFGIGAHITELLGDLRETSLDGEDQNETPEAQNLIDRLNRAFGNLTEVVQAPEQAANEALLEPVVAGFCDALDSIAAERPDLEAKCSDLQQKARRFLDPPGEDTDTGYPFEEEDIPF